eukprot:s1939_g12.t1
MSSPFRNAMAAFEEIPNFADDDLRVLLRSLGTDQLCRVMGIGHSALMQMDAHYATRIQLRDQALAMAKQTMVAQGVAPLQPPFAPLSKAKAAGKGADTSPPAKAPGTTVTAAKASEPAVKAMPSAPQPPPMNPAVARTDAGAGAAATSSTSPPAAPTATTAAPKEKQPTLAKPVAKAEGASTKPSSPPATLPKSTAAAITRRGPRVQRTDADGRLHGHGVTGPRAHDGPASSDSVDDGSARAAAASSHGALLRRLGAGPRELPAGSARGRCGGRVAPTSTSSNLPPVLDSDSEDDQLDDDTAEEDDEDQGDDDAPPADTQPPWARDDAVPRHQEAQGSGAASSADAAPTVAEPTVPDPPVQDPPGRAVAFSVSQLRQQGAGAPGTTTRSVGPPPRMGGMARATFWMATRQWCGRCPME